jgi:hypothetical protein
VAQTRREVWLGSVHLNRRFVDCSKTRQERSEMEKVIRNLFVDQIQLRSIKADLSESLFSARPSNNEQIAPLEIIMNGLKSVLNTRERERERERARFRRCQNWL